MSYERNVYALPIDDQQFTTTLSVQELLDLVVPGRAFLPRAKNDPVTDRIVRQLTDYHDRIQRDLKGRKLSNAKSELKDYLLTEWIGEEGTGVLPPFIIFFPNQLEVTTKSDVCEPLRKARIPAGTKGLLLDAESRVEAMLYALEDATDEQVPLLLGKRISVLVFHGLDVHFAAKYFADINGKGVGVNPNLLVARDFTDEWNTAALEVFRQLEIALEQDKRQVSAKSDAVITALQARLMVAAVAVGVGAVSYGSKAIPKKDARGDGVDFVRLEKAAVQWLRQVFDRFGTDAVKDKTKVLRSAPVLVSLGAIGHGFYSGDSKAHGAAHTFLGDNSIDWKGGEHWAGIAGKMNAAGRFSVGSGKESAWATYRALTDPKDPGYRRIRGGKQEEGGTTNAQQ